MEAKQDKRDAEMINREEGCSQNINAPLTATYQIAGNQLKDLSVEGGVPGPDSVPSAAENEAFVDVVMKQALLFECGKEAVNSYLGQSTSRDYLARCSQQSRDETSSSTTPMPKRRGQVPKKGKHLNQELPAKAQATREIVQSAEPCRPEKNLEADAALANKSSKSVPTSTAQTIITIQKQGGGPASKQSTSILRDLLKKKKLKVASWQTQYVLEPQHGPLPERVVVKRPPSATLPSSLLRSQKAPRRIEPSSYSERKNKLLEPKPIEFQTSPKPLTPSPFSAMNPVIVLSSVPSAQIPFNTVVTLSTSQLGQRTSISYQQTSLTSSFNVCSVSPSTFGSPLLCSVSSSVAAPHSQSNSYVFLQPVQPVVLRQGDGSLQQGAARFNTPPPIVPRGSQNVNVVLPSQHFQNSQCPGTSKDIQQTSYEQMSCNQKIVVSTHELQQSTGQARLISTTSSCLESRYTEAPFTAPFNDFVKVRLQGEQVGAQWVLLPKGCVPQGISSPPLPRKHPQRNNTGKQPVDVQFKDIPRIQSDVEDATHRFDMAVSHERVMDMNSAYTMSSRDGINTFDQSDARIFAPIPQGRQGSPCSSPAAHPTRVDSPAVGARPSDIRIGTTTISTPSLTYVSQSSKCRTLHTASQVTISSESSGVCDEQRMHSPGPHTSNSSAKNTAPKCNSLSNYFGPVDMYVYLPEDAFKKGSITYMSLDN